MDPTVTVFIQKDKKRTGVDVVKQLAGKGGCFGSEKRMQSPGGAQRTRGQPGLEVVEVPPMQEVEHEERHTQHSMWLEANVDSLEKEKSDGKA